jgi:hypothetical protein
LIALKREKFPRQQSTGNRAVAKPCGCMLFSSPPDFFTSYSSRTQGVLDGPFLHESLSYP